MPLTCAKLAAPVALDCNNLPVPGTDEVIYLGNFSQKGTTPFTGGIYTNIALAATGQRLYKIEASNQVVVPTTELVTEGVAPGHTHNVAGVWPSLGATELDELEKLLLGRVFCIVQKYYSPSPKFFIFGWTNGMRASALAWELNNTATDGLPSFTISTLPGFKEPKLPRELLITDYDTTLAQLETLATTGQP